MLKPKGQFLWITVILFSLAIFTASCEEEPEEDSMQTRQVKEHQSGGAVMPPDNDFNDTEENSELEGRSDSSAGEACEEFIETVDELTLLLSLEEMCRGAYVDKYGEADLLDNPVTAVAERLGKAEINWFALEAGRLKPGDRLFLNFFDGGGYVVLIDSASARGDSLSLRGELKCSGHAVFSLSVTENQVLATVRMADMNTFYLLKYNGSSAQHYLYQAPLDKIEVKKEAPRPERPD